MAKEKYDSLIKYLKKLESVVVAFSGGVDSTFLLKAAKEALGDNAAALTIISPYIPKWEIEEAKELVKKIDIRHEFIEVPIIDQIKFNPEDRCYLCKKGIFSLIKDFTNKNGYKYVVDGTNLDDTKDYRPGIRALKELGIKSPLIEKGLTKKEIRELSKELGLETWQKPAYACLLSRIPYGREINLKELEMIENAEKYLMNLGFKAVRVRLHENLARIEVPKDDISRLLSMDILDNISEELKGFGFKYVSLDIQGYRTGSLNEEICLTCKGE